MKDIRFVVIHKPGPAWKPGVPMFEQEGLQQHVEHYRHVLGEGKLAIGGPFLDAIGGGFMIPESGVTEDDARRFAADDPTVKSGLLTFEIRPWLVGMKK